MTPETLSRLSSLLDEALDLDEPSREAWLATLPDDVAELGPTLRKLLARQATKETADLLERGPAFTLPAATDPDPTAFQPGDTVGPYRLLRALGHGGMGEVWQAERADGTLKRKVALKLPHVTWAPGLAERFAREREILASLEHPHIARLYDAGLDPHGRPYMALEYVEGLPIDEFCQRRALSVEGRLQLLLQVADAVAFAHSRLVIHRDLKPGNILVTEDGQVRLLDFGIAKLIKGEATQESALTRLGGRALTLDYASPEQIRGEPIGTASDVYSLAVVAFELLAGARPYRLKRGSAAELEEAITGQDLPLASSIAQEPVAKKALSGALDAILNKALKRDPAERYPTVDALAQDWRRHLASERVLARPDSFDYRIRRLTARHRVPLAVGGMAAVAFVLALGFGATALVIAALLVGVGAALWQARAAARERDHALRLLSRTEGVVEFLNLLITEAAESPRPITVSDLLTRSEALAAAAFQHAPEQQAMVLSILGSHHLHLDEKEKAEALFRRAVDTARDSGDASFKARLECEYAVSLADLWHLDEARTRLLAIAGRTDIDAGTSALCFRYLSHVAIKARDGPAGVGYARQALERLKSAPKASPAVEAECTTYLASALAMCGRIVEADRAFAKVLALFAALGRESSPVTTLLLLERAVMHGNAGDPRTALTLEDEALALSAKRGDNRFPAKGCTSRNYTLQQLGHVDAAIEGYCLALTAAEQTGDLRSARDALTSLAIAALDTGKIDDARELLERAEGIGAGALPTDPQRPRQLHVVRGRLALATGRLAQAREEFTAALEVRTPTNLTLLALSRRAEVGLQEGNLDAALQDAQDALDLGKQLQGSKPYSWRTGDASLVQGRILARQGDAPRARAAYETALAHFSNTVDPSHPAMRQLQQLLVDEN